MNLTRFALVAAMGSLLAAPSWAQSNNPDFTLNNRGGIGREFTSKQFQCRKARNESARFRHKKGSVVRGYGSEPKPQSRGFSIQRLGPILP